MSSDSLPALAPPLGRRLLCLVYECVLLFGIVMLAGLAYGTVTRQSHALQGQWGLRAVLFCVLGVYFVGFWTRAGQTLAMKTWHIRLVDLKGDQVRPGRALARFLLAWLWVLPALAMAHFSGLAGGAWITGFVAAGVLAYAALSRLHPSRQFWHDVVCGTRLIDTRPTASGRALGLRED